MLLVPQNLMLDLLPALVDEKTVDSASEKLRGYIKTGEVKLLADLFATGTSGERFVAESLEEYKYPTEFDPPQLPEKLPQLNALETLKAWPAVSITPTGFETRNVGQSLEVDAAVSTDGKTIQTNVIPTHVRLLRTVKYDSGRLANGERLGVEQPIFHSMRNVATVTLRNGQHILLGVHRAPAPDEGFELFLFSIKADRVIAAP